MGKGKLRNKDCECGSGLKGKKCCELILKLSIREIMDRHLNVYDGLVEKIKSNNKSKAILSIQRNNENMLTLEKKFHNLRSKEENLYAYEPKISKVPLKDVQAEFVEHQEVFFQGIYSTISSFVNVINLIAPAKFKQDLSISSIKKFLNQLNQKLPGLSNEIKEIEKARDFRAKYVDHIQQNPIHDWATTSWFDEKGMHSTVIYFIRIKDKDKYNVFFPGVKNLNPYTKDFKPNFECEEYYVPPYYRSVFVSMKKIINTTIQKISSEDNKIYSR